MIPRTFPSTYASNGQQQMLVHFLTDVTGLQRWSDYIPVKLAQTGTENSYANDGYIDVKVLSPLTASTQAWKEYIPVYVDDEATDTWTVNATGYIPYGYALFGDASMQLDLTNGGYLDPRITFTRASTATYFNSVGVLTTTGFNLLTYSEQFDNAAWVTAAPYTVTANTAISPDGTQDADSVILDNGSLSFLSGITKQTVTKAASAIQYTRSEYFKALGATTSVRIYDFGATTSDRAGVIISLVDGRVVTGASATGGFSGASVAVSNAGNGWWRVALTYTTDAHTSLTVRSFPYVGATQLTGDGTSGLLVWGAQLETGSAATVYIPTTSATSGAARFDYDPVTLAPKGLLIEEQRTQLFLQSGFAGAVAGENMGTAPTSWTIGFGVGVTASLPASTLGTDAVAIKLDAPNGTRGYYQQTITVAAGQYAVSAYVEAVEGLIGQFITIISGTATATITQTANNPATGRQTLLFTSSGAGTVTIRIGVGTTGVVVGDASVTFSRPQVESGSFNTSYIPTTTAAATRAADVAVMQGANFSNWYNAVEGTLYAESRCPNGISGNINRIASLNDGTTSNRIEIDTGSTAATVGRIQAGGVSQGAPSAGSYTDFQLRKSALAIQVDNFTLAANTSLNSDTSALVPVVNRLMIGQSPAASSNYLNGTISRIAYFPRRLSDAELQGITS